MANGQTGLSLAAPPGGGAPFVSSGKKGGIDLDQVLPLLLLVSPLLEMRSPGSGMGLAAGIVGYQKEKQEKRRRDSMGLLQLLSEFDDESLGAAEEFLVGQGYDRQLVKAIGKASRGMVDPGRKAERALNQLVEDPSLGLIPRRTQIDIQARQQATEQDVARESAINERERLEEEARFRREQEARAVETGAGRKFSLEGEARQLLIQLATSSAIINPQFQARVVALQRRLSAGEDPQVILAEASALAGEVGQAGAAQSLRQRQAAFRKERLGELEAEVASAVPAAAERIRNLAKEQGLNPAPYLQRLAQNIRLQKLQEQALARQAAGPQGGLSLADLRLLFFTGQLDPSKLSDDQRRLIGLEPKEKAKFVAPPSRQQAAARVTQINNLMDKILALSEGGKLTADQEIKYQKELDQLNEELDRLTAFLRKPRGR